jgi:hypothetical protein
MIVGWRFAVKLWASRVGGAATEGRGYLVYVVAWTLRHTGHSQKANFP